MELPELSVTIQFSHEDIGIGKGYDEYYHQSDHILLSMTTGFGLPLGSQPLIKPEPKMEPIKEPFRNHTYESKVGLEGNLDEVANIAASGSRGHPP